MPSKKSVQPYIFTVFGASGDLARLKIFPTLYELARQGYMPRSYAIVGFARTDMTRAQFQKLFKKSLREQVKGKLEKKVVDSLVKHVYYFSGQYKEIRDFEKYQEFIKKIRGKKQMTHCVYFSVPPFLFQDIVRNIALTRTSKKEDIRLILEKPFGESKHSAEQLFHFIFQYFTKNQIYLLDHYLGKSSVRSILNLRRNNRMLYYFMRGQAISNIQITKFEDFGVKNRAGYFDQVGIIKDMVQSHLLQVLAIVAMEIPNKDTAQSLQRERLSILSAIDCPCDEKNVVIGQYQGYKKINKVTSGSRTETFAAMRLFLDKEDWYQTPIYIRTGKHMHENHTYIVIELEKFDFQDEKTEPNRIILELTPEEQINITLVNTQEDVDQIQKLRTTSSIACAVEGCLPEHAVLFLDVLRGEKKHFLSFEEVVAAWDVIDQVSRLYKKHRLPLRQYAKGSRGPGEQDSLTKMDGCTWYDVH